jgi:hypothetical protein
VALVSRLVVRATSWQQSERLQIQKIHELPSQVQTTAPLQVPGRVLPTATPRQQRATSSAAHPVYTLPAALYCMHLPMDILGAQAASMYSGTQHMTLPSRSAAPASLLAGTSGA